jgi:hypothetical protein
MRVGGRDSRLSEQTAGFAPTFGDEDAASASGSGQASPGYTVMEIHCRNITGGLLLDMATVATFKRLAIYNKQDRDLNSAVVAALHQSRIGFLHVDVLPVSDLQSIMTMQCLSVLSIGELESTDQVQHDQCMAAVYAERGLVHLNTLYFDDAQSQCLLFACLIPSIRTVRFRMRPGAAMGEVVSALLLKRTEHGSPLLDELYLTGEHDWSSALVNAVGCATVRLRVPKVLSVERFKVAQTTDVRHFKVEYERSAGFDHRAFASGVLRTVATSGAFAAQLKTLYVLCATNLNVAVSLPEEKDLELLTALHDLEEFGTELVATDSMLRNLTKWCPSLATLAVGFADGAFFRTTLPGILTASRIQKFVVLHPALASRLPGDGVSVPPLSGFTSAVISREAFGRSIGMHVTAAASVTAEPDKDDFHRMILVYTRQE